MHTPHILAAAGSKQRRRRRLLSATCALMGAALGSSERGKACARAAQSLAPCDACLLTHALCRRPRIPHLTRSFNDGLGGGDQVHDNAIFNMNRESADHGSINCELKQLSVLIHRRAKSLSTRPPLRAQSRWNGASSRVALAFSLARLTPAIPRASPPPPPPFAAPPAPWSSVGPAALCHDGL